MAVDQDAASGKYVPSSSAQWTELLAGTGIANPTSLWLCQEASGNLADSIGSNTLTAFNTPVYQSNVAGWTRKAAYCDDTVDTFYSTAIGNTATTSYALFAYIVVPSTPGSTGNILTVGNPGSDNRNAAVTNAPAYRAQGFGVTGVSGASNPSTTARKVLLLFNRASSTFSVFTEQETINTTWVNPTSGAASYLSLGDGCISKFLYACAWSGVNAEMDAADITTLFNRLDNGATTYTVSGTVTISGAAAADGEDVIIFADNGDGTWDEIDTVQIAGGAGGFTCTVPDNTRDYFAKYDDGTNRGVSALDTPV